MTNDNLNGKVFLNEIFRVFSELQPFERRQWRGETYIYLSVYVPICAFRHIIVDNRKEFLTWEFYAEGFDYDRGCEGIILKMPHPELGEEISVTCMSNSDGSHSDDIVSPNLRFENNCTCLANGTIGEDGAISYERTQGEK